MAAAASERATTSASGSAVLHTARAIAPAGVAVVVYDGVGGALSVESLRCCGFGARFVVVGWAATPDVAKGKGGRGAPNVNVLPTNLILMKGLHVIGSPTAIATHRDPGLRAGRLAALREWIEAGRLRPVVAEGYPLERIADAMRAKWGSTVVGGIVVRP